MCYPSFHRHDPKNSILAGTWLGRAGGGGGLLAFELDAAGGANGLSFFRFGLATFWWSMLWSGHAPVVRSGRVHAKILCCFFVSRRRCGGCLSCSICALPIGNTSDATCSPRSSTICFAQSRSQLSFPQSLKLRR